MATMTVDCIPLTKVEDAVHVEGGYRCPFCPATFDEWELVFWGNDNARRLPYHTREATTETRDVPYLD